MTTCTWCNYQHAQEKELHAYWELPDGLRAVQITAIPSIHCTDCGMEYQEEEVIEQIEEQLMLVDFKKLPESFSYAELMATPKIMKRNYFG